MTTHLDNTALKEFRQLFSGEILLPEDVGYDEARKLFNAMIDRHPAVMAQCADVADVVSAVNFGRRLGLEIAVRGRQWWHRLRRDLSPLVSGSVYLNFIGDEGKARIIAGFGEANYARLSRIKAQYDPQNLFHLNQNIAPA